MVCWKLLRVNNVASMSTVTEVVACSLMFLLALYSCCIDGAISTVQNCNFSHPLQWQFKFVIVSTIPMHSTKSCKPIFCTIGSIKNY